MLSHVTQQEFPLLLTAVIAGAAAGATFAGSLVLRRFFPRRRDR